MSSKLTYILGGIVIALVLVISFTVFNVIPQASGSIIEGQAYNATTTYAAHPLDVRLLKTGQGSLGSVVITGDNSGTIELYNATTSNINNRTGNIATSSIWIADVPASAPENTYVYDVQFTTGLLMVTTGTEATSTVTWR